MTDSEYIEKAYEQANKSACCRLKVGAIFVKNDEIIAQGYNNITGGVKDCTTLGCLRDELKIPHGERREMCRAICAEQLAITEAARNGISLDGSICYVTSFPCFICAKMLASAGIKKIVYDKEHDDNFSKVFLREAGIIYENVNGGNTNEEDK